MRTQSPWLRVIALLITAVILGLATVQAIRDHSLEPLWTLGWIPAVLVATVSRPRAHGECLPRSRRRPR